MNNIEDLLRTLQQHNIRKNSKSKTPDWISRLPRGGGLMSPTFSPNYGALFPELTQMSGQQGGLMTDFNLLAQQLSGIRPFQMPQASPIPQPIPQPTPQLPAAPPPTPAQQQQIVRQKQAMSGPNRFAVPMGVFFGK